MKIRREEEKRKTPDGRDWKEIKESIEFDGAIYTRSGYEINGEVSHPIESEHFTNDHAKIGVLCGDCQGKHFQLAYGDYEISAQCVKCGFDSVVYSG